MASDVIMKNTSLAITFFAIAAFAVGWKPSDDNSTSKQLDNVKNRTESRRAGNEGLCLRAKGGIHYKYAGPI
jgi:hypothetical protein